MATRTLLIIAWIIMILLTMTQYAEEVVLVQVPKENKIIAGLILILGAPIFCAHAALSGLLDIFIPGGWNDDDNEFRH